MNNFQHYKHTTYFARLWLEKVLTWCRRRRGFLYRLRTCGHMHCRLTLLGKDPQKISIEDFLRIQVNMAMEFTKEEYFEQWNELGNMIYSLAEESGDEFNEQFCRKHIAAD